MMESFFGTAPSASQTPNVERSHTADAPLNFGVRLSPLVTPANVFEGELNLGSGAVAGPSLGGLRGQSVGKKTMAPNWGRMMARPSPNVAFPLRVIEMKKRERRENFESYLEDNWEDLDNERLSELHYRLVKLRDQRTLLDKQIQGLEEYMGEIWEEAQRRIENAENA